MIRNSVTDQFKPFRQPDNTTVSARVIAGELRLFLTLDDGREASRVISTQVAESFWKRRRHFVVDDLLKEMRTELGAA